MKLVALNLTGGNGRVALVNPESVSHLITIGSGERTAVQVHFIGKAGADCISVAGTDLEVAGKLEA